jgi:hypothetical protein
MKVFVHTLVVLFLTFGLTTSTLSAQDNDPPPETFEEQQVLINEDSKDGMDLLEKHQSLIANGAVEISSRRSGNSMNYELADGKKAILLSSMPIMYQDRSGKNQLIDNSLTVDTSRDGYHYKNQAHAFSIYFPESSNRQADILLKSQTGYEISLWGQAALWYENASGESVIISQAAETTGNVEENTITYPERYPGISEIFSVRYTGVKHSLEIAELPEFLSGQQDGFLVFQETMTLPQGTQILVDGLLQAEDFITDKEIVFNNPGGTFLGKIPVPWIHENNRENYDPIKDSRLFLTYNVQFIDDRSIMVSVRVPVDWLKEPERIYPVTVDPSFNCFEDTGNDDGYQVNSAGFNGDADFLAVGYSSALGFPYPFTHMTFHDVNIPQGSTIDTVILHYKVYQTDSNLCSFKWIFEDSDNSNPIIYGPLVASRDYVDTYNYHSSYGETWTAGENRTIGDFYFGLQEVIDRPGWSSGNNISLAWTPYAAVGGYRLIYSYEGGVAPYLYIAYTEPPDDNYEPNDTRATAYILDDYEQTWLINIDSMGVQRDDDWYRIYVSPGYERVLINADFYHDQGNIDIGLYNLSGYELAYSKSVSDDENIDFTVDYGDAYYYIKVYGDNAGNFYDLWWDDLMPPICYTLDRSHFGSGLTPVASPVKSDECSTSYTYVADEYITLQATPDVDWWVGSWSGTDNDSSTSSTNHVTMPASNHSISVTYKTDGYNIFVPLLIKN